MIKFGCYLYLVCHEKAGEGVSDVKRPEVVSGGLMLSLAGWISAKALRGTKDRIKGDEYILWDGNFVQEVLESSR